MQFIPAGMWKQTSEVANARKTQDGEQTYLNGNYTPSVYKYCELPQFKPNFLTIERNP